MRNSRKTWCAALAMALLAGLQACGGGSSGGGDSQGASLAFQVRWQQAQTLEEPPFGAPITDEVSSIRIIVRSQSSACCVQLRRGDAAFNERRVVLTGLPEGRANVDVSGFPVGPVPNGGVSARCIVKDPEGDGSACDPTGCGHASYAPSEVVVTDLHAGEETDVVPLTEVPRPFVLDGADPACDATPSDPAELRLTVAQVDTGACACVDGFLECPRGGQGELEDPQLFQVLFDGPCSEAPASATRIRIENGIAHSLCCSDAPNEDGSSCVASDSCCRSPFIVVGPDSIAPTPSGLPLIGYQMEIVDSQLDAGCAEIRVPVPGLPGGTGPVVHAFVAITPRVTVTPTPTLPTPTLTPSSPSPVGTGNGDLRHIR